MKINIKRIYETPDNKDGYRILIDRLWPRGIAKTEAHIDEWIKEIAPSNELRKWFGHQPELFGEFSKKYKAELKDKTELLSKIKSIAKKQTVTLLYGAKDTVHNQAVILQEVLNNA